MEGNELDKYIDNIREMEDSLSVTVKLGWREVLKVVVEDLIKKRNSPSNQKREAFDIVLKYYLGDEDFEKYVINEKPLE